MISKEQVKYIAKLSRIELSDRELGKFQKDLSSVLDYVKQLNKVNTKNVERIAQITGLKDVMRQDKAVSNEQGTANKILKNTPSRKGEYIKVPKILE